MGIGKRIKEARESKKLTQKELSALVGVTSSAIANYESGVSHPKENVLYKLIKILDVDANYLFQDVVHLSEKYNLTLNEQSLVNDYRRLDPHGKEIVDATLKIEIKRIDDEQRKQEERQKAQEAAKKKATNKIVEMPETKEWVLPSYDISASAGTGTIFDESECTPMVLKSEPPYGAAFIIPITGDSMTPKFHDGDYVFVRPQPTIDIGQIGIFYHDGGSYIKQLGNGELVSLNPEYPNIKIDEYTHCFGRVLGVYKPDETETPELDIREIARANDEKDIFAIKRSPENDVFVNEIYQKFKNGELDIDGHDI